MNIAGIIAEYNPFHLGHRHHLEETRRLTGADYVIVVLSGNFVQRGEPAILDKSLRTRMALMGGADCVLELSAPFACASAEDFAMGAVSLLHKLGTVNTLSFGSECGELRMLTQASQILLHEPAVFRRTLKARLREGASYPRARSAALTAAGTDTGVCAAAAEPNNLLGIEYLNALSRLNSPIRPFTLPRRGNTYHDLSLHADGYCSASALREALVQLYKTDSAAPYHSFLSRLPETIRSLYPEDAIYPIFPDDCSLLLNYRILSGQNSGEIFSSFLDISSELAGRLTRQALDNRSFTGRIAALKTRQYTYTRISRGLLHLLLNIRQKEMEAYRKNGFSSYARILGFKKNASPLLKNLKAHSTIPLITKPADAPALLSPEALSLWEKDIYCSHVYRTLVEQKYPVALPDEYRRPPIIL